MSSDLERFTGASADYVPADVDTALIYENRFLSEGPPVVEAALELMLALERLGVSLNCYDVYEHPRFRIRSSILAPTGEIAKRIVAAGDDDACVEDMFVTDRGPVDIDWCIRRFPSADRVREFAEKTLRDADGWRDVSTAALKRTTLSRLCAKAGIDYRDEDVTIYIGDGTRECLEPWTLDKAFLEGDTVAEKSFSAVERLATMGLTSARTALRRENGRSNGR